jgi:transcription elongation factor Elf1
MRRIGEEEGPLECPRCRAEAEWRFLDETKEVVEILCSDCGRFEMSRTDFEQAESDVIEAPERRD